MENFNKEIEYDVVIIGGGTSGCSCAYNCANNGLKTLLIEKNNYLGGLMTGGLVVPIMKSSTSDLNCDYYKKLISVAKDYEAQITYSDGNDGWLNPELLKIIIEDALDLPNLDILFESSVYKIEKSENKIKKIYLDSNTLSIPVVANYFIDATGSGDFSKKCGCQTINDSTQKQQNSLRFILGNVDIKKFVEFILNVDDNRDITNTYRNDTDTNNEIHFTTASTWDTNKLWNVDKILKNAVDDGVLKDSDRQYFQLFSVAGSNSQVAFNCPRINNYNNNPYMYSKELIEAKRAIYRFYQFSKRYLAGFENAIITNIATQTGIREQNRIKTKYIYTKDDIYSSKSFDNPVLEADYPIDIHSAKKNKSTLTKLSKYQLPIESLISADIDNLFVVGKLVGSDFESHSALRVQKSCMSMGEAVAKYIAKK